MEKIENLEACTACTACVSICPTNCIDMKENEDGFLYPNINKNKCINCKKCESVCPELLEENIPEHKKAWYGWAKDEKIRQLSSSGGAFTILANNILNSNGIIYAAIFDVNNKKTIHKSTNDISIDYMRKSKYSQSDLDKTIMNIKADLECGKRVMLVATACHIAGIKSYFRTHKNYENLILCDFICHGVPSPKILKEHLEYIERKKRNRIKEVDFRPKNHKKRPWSEYTLKLTFDDDKIYNPKKQLDWYMQAFLNKNITLRKSCFKCRYSEKQHPGDITLADFWGINRYKPEINDEKGISLIISNTKKGSEVVRDIENNFNLYSLEWSHAEYIYKKHNKGYDIEKRNDFFYTYREKGYEFAMKKYVQSDINKNIIMYPIKKVISMVKR